LIERRVSEYIQSSFSFVVLPMENKENRLRLESIRGRNETARVHHASLGRRGDPIFGSRACR
jgi:hypothetical protein